MSTLTMERLSWINVAIDVTVDFLKVYVNGQLVHTDFSLHSFSQNESVFGVDDIIQFTGGMFLKCSMIFAK